MSDVVISLIEDLVEDEDFDGLDELEEESTFKGHICEQGVCAGYDEE